MIESMVEKRYDQLKVSETATILCNSMDVNEITKFQASVTELEYMHNVGLIEITDTRKESHTGHRMTTVMTFTRLR